MLNWGTSCFMTPSFHTPLDICWCRLQSQVLRFFQVAYLNNLLLVCCDICRHISKGPFECTSLDSEKTEPTFLLLPQSLVFPSLSVVQFLHAKLEHFTAVCFCWRLWWVCPATTIYHSTTRSTACSSHVAITSTTCNNHANDFSTACYSTVWSYTSMPTSSMACMPTVHQPNHTNTGDLPGHLPGSFAAAIFHAVGLWTCFACASLHVERKSGFVLIFGWIAVGEKAYTLLIMHLSLCGHTPVRKGAKFLGVFQSEITWCTVTPHHPRFLWLFHVNQANF